MKQIDRYAVLTIIIMVFPDIVMTDTIQNDRCPSECFCNLEQTSVSCVNKSLEHIPQLPSYVTNLIFEGNNLKYITDKTLHNLRNLNIEILSLANNSIQYIDPLSFDGLNNLQSLDLGNNPQVTPAMVHFATHHLNQNKFNTLLLNSLMWKEEPANLFMQLAGFNIHTLSLKTANFYTLSFELLGMLLPGIVNIDLSYGSLKNVTSGYLPHLSKLELHYNYIDIGKAFFTNHDGSCSFPNLRELRLDSNFIINFDKRFYCLDQLRNLTLDDNPVKTIKSESFSKLKSLEYLSLRSLGDRLYKIESFAFRSSTLRTLSLAGNGINFDDSTMGFQFDKHNIFKHAPNLTELDLSENFFNFSTDVFNSMVLPAKALRKLVMTSCQLTTLPTGFLYNMKHLKTFIVNYNRIDTWNGTRVFSNRTMLHTLNLQGNSINIIDKDKFPLDALQKLENLDLSYNPFECSCNNFWFRQWTKKNPTLFQDFPHGYHCRYSNERKRVDLENYNPTLSVCTDKKVFVIVVASLSIFGIAFITVISIVFKARWHIRYWIYLLYIKRKGYSSLDINEEYNYDGFVIYCDEDTEWVRNELLNQLEEKRTFKLCVHHRDFEGGKLIVDNIAENMSMSKKIIIVISRDMVKSDWCLFETRVAQEKFLNKEMDALVILMLENVPNLDMPTSLRTLINSTTYLQWEHTHNDEDTFWDQVEKAMF